MWINQKTLRKANTMSEQTSQEDRAFLRWLVETSGYSFPGPLPGGRYVCLEKRPFNTRIVTGRIGDIFGYDDAW